MANSRRAARKRKQDELEAAFEKLEDETPGVVARAIIWLHKPESRWVRWPLGILFIAAGFMSFLPGVGIELLPIGLLLIAQDVPFLRRPVGLGVLWLLERWVKLRKWCVKRWQTG